MVRRLQDMSRRALYRAASGPRAGYDGAGPIGAALAVAGAEADEDADAKMVMQPI